MDTALPASLVSPSLGGAAYGDASPITDNERAGLLAPLWQYDNLVLAVSGGADSIALMRLAAAESVSRKTHVCVVTVDHQLRDQSREEACWVGSKAHELGLDHEILTWSRETDMRQSLTDLSGLQSHARDARYALLCGYSCRFSNAAVVTAHTLDDQAETLLMRLARGSGLDGLSAMASSRPLGDGVDLLRPLLAVPKSRLVAALVADGVGWLEDPSNDCEKFERVRLRRAGDLLASVGLTPEKLALSARRLQRVRVAIDAMVRDAFSTHVTHHDGAFAEFKRTAFLNLETEVQVRLLGHLVRAFGGGGSSFQSLARIERLAEFLASGARSAVTVGGCLISAGAQSVRIYREPERISHEADIVLRPGDTAQWDGRFVVSLLHSDGQGVASAHRSVEVRALGSETFRHLRATMAGFPRMPARAGAGLPGFWVGSRLVAVPQVGFSCPEMGHFCQSQFLGLPPEGTS